MPGWRRGALSERLRAIPEGRRADYAGIRRQTFSRWRTGTQEFNPIDAGERMGVKGN